MKGRKNFFATIGLFFIAFIIGILFLWHTGAFSFSKKPANRLLAPDFKLESLGDGEKALKDYRGKVVLLDFWSIGCPYCRRAVPYLVTIYKKYKSKGFVVLGISFDRKEIERLRSFIERYNVTYTTLLGDMDVARAYGVRSIPSIFVLDRKGYIRLHRIGYNEEIGNEIEEIVKALVKEK